MFSHIDADWRQDARCFNDPKIDTGFFFPANKAEELEAKKYCDQCLVKQDCLNWAILNKMQDGIWGGLTGDERYKERKRRSRMKRMGIPA